MTDTAVTDTAGTDTAVTDPAGTDTAVTDPAATVDRYLAAWNATDEAERAGLVAGVWSTDAELVDPPMAGAGHVGVSAVAAALHAQFPGHRFRRSSGVDAHHDALRFAWELVGPDGGVALTGLDVALVALDGRLRRVTGFFGELPPA